MANFDHNAASAAQSLGLRAGERRRVSCPNCGGRDTFTVWNNAGTLVWNCYRASCKASGAKDIGLDAESVRRRFRDVTEKEDNFVLPDYLTYALGNEEVVAYLQKNHCLWAYSNSLADIRYDPKQNRVVFVVRHEGRVVDATGRAMTADVRPKWLRYGRSNYPFICGRGKIGVVVEDAASACAVAPVATGIALMGTSLQDAYLGVLRSFDQVILALDPDATGKALDMSRYVSYFKDAKVVRIDDDLKYFGPDRVRTMLGIG